MATRLYGPGFTTVYPAASSGHADPTITFGLLISSPLSLTGPNVNRTITTSTTLIRAAVRESRAKRLELSVYNNSDQTVFIGEDSALTTASGTHLKPGATARFSEQYLGPVYGVVASGTSDVRVWEMIIV